MEAAFHRDGGILWRIAMPKCVLADRTILSVSGPDAPTFLQGLLTSDVVDLADGAASSAALLTPQGKVLL